MVKRENSNLTSSILGMIMLFSRAPRLYEAQSCYVLQHPEYNLVEVSIVLEFCKFVFVFDSKF